MDAHLRAALRRNLDFAAIRVTIAAEQRVVAKRALRTLRSRTTVRRDLDGLQNVRADECAQRAPGAASARYGRPLQCGATATRARAATRTLWRSCAASTA